MMKVFSLIYLDELFLTSNGEQIDIETGKEFWKIRDYILNKTKTMETEKISFREFLHENYNTELSRIVSDNNTRNALIEWFIKFEEEDSGCDTLDNLSLSGLFFYKFIH